MLLIIILVKSASTYVLV